MASIHMHSLNMGLQITEVAGGYILAETGEIAPVRAMGRLFGVSFILAGLGLLAVPVGVGFVVKGVLALALIVAGGVVAARAGRNMRMELEVDLEKRTIRKRRLVREGEAHLVAQWSFDVISGLDVEGEAGRGALFVQTGARRRALLTGAPEALRAAALRIGSDLLRTRKSVKSVA